MYIVYFAEITIYYLKLFINFEINSFDIANTYEGDYDADKVDYFFAHSEHLFDYVNKKIINYIYPGSKGIDFSAGEILRAGLTTQRTR